MHYVLVRREFGGCSGPGNGWSGRDRIEVMAASRTEKGLRRRQNELGGTILCVDGPFRRYELNELLYHINR